MRFIMLVLALLSIGGMTAFGYAVIHGFISGSIFGQDVLFITFIFCIIYLMIQNIWSLGAGALARMIDNVISIIPGVLIYIWSGEIDLNPKQVYMYWMIVITVLYDLVFNGFLGAKILELKDRNFQTSE